MGETAAAVLKGTEQVGTWTGECVQFEDVGAAVAALTERLRPGDVVLIKGSRVAGLERVAQAVVAAVPPKGGDDA
jgi:UDP-N-acetylmuramoyl-tripeptide--D-alanyl-D-alanine ligase